MVVDFLRENTFRIKIVEIVEDFAEKSYNNNGKHWKSSMIMRERTKTSEILRDFAFVFGLFFIFHFFHVSFFLNILHYSSFSFFVPIFSFLLLLNSSFLFFIFIFHFLNFCMLLLFFL